MHSTSSLSHLHAIKTVVGSNSSFRFDEDHHDPILIHEFLRLQWEKALRGLLSSSSAASESSSSSSHSRPCHLEELSSQWLNRLLDHYSHTSRHYHNLIHLWEMLSWVESLEQDNFPLSSLLSRSTSSTTTTTTTTMKTDIMSISEKYSAMRLATFFHDVIYDPTSPQNEQKSAELWDEFCIDYDRETCDHEDDDLIKKLSHIVRTLILATEKHQVVVITADEDDDGNDPLLRQVDIALQEIFLDVDMAALGKSSTAYLSYASLIRKEYQHVPKDVYCTKRAEILESFCMEPKTIYLSSLFQQLLEVQAKKNLRNEIDLLKQGIIPTGG